MKEIDALQILEDAAELKRLKSQDYQGGLWSEEDYFPFGHESYMHMIHTKYMRMRSVMDQDEPNFESLDDTLIDMINYCAMYAAFIKKQRLAQFFEEQDQ